VARALDPTGIRCERGMSSSNSHARNLLTRGLHAAIAMALLLPGLFDNEVLAQTTDIGGGFAVRDVSLSTGYASVQLPPITLGGNLPTDVLNADLITTAAADLDWRRLTPRTAYRFELFGTYTARGRYSQLSAPGGNLTFGLVRTLGRRWRLDAGVTDALINSDQLAYWPTQTRRLIDDAGSFAALAGAVALVRSPNPDLTQAVLFVPISQSLVASDLIGNRIMASSAEAAATYKHSVRLATYFRGSYTTVRRISSTNESALVLPVPDSSAENVSAGLRYDRSERTQLTADLSWSRTSGLFTDEIAIATAGYGWSGRKWFMVTTVGAGLQPFQTAAGPAPATTIEGRSPMIIGSALIGYKFRTQALLVEYRRASHNDYGQGGRNTATGFEGNVQSIVGSWSWSAPRSQWMAQSDFSVLRRPGNFSYIYAWLSTVDIGRQLGPNLRLMAEGLFDRHGSRGFEGFHLSREEARLNFIWTPRRRPIAQEPLREVNR